MEDALIEIASCSVQKMKNDVSYDHVGRNNFERRICIIHLSESQRRMFEASNSITVGECNKHGVKEFLP